MTKRFLGTLGLALCCVPSFGQFAPVSAKVREVTVHILANGTQKTHQREGVFFRLADGSTLTQWSELREGKCVGSDGSLIDNQQMKVFLLSGDAQPQLKKQLIKRIQPMPRSDAKPENVLGHEIVEGISCEVNPMYLQPRNVRVGQTCWANDYDLLLKSAGDLPDGRGGRAIRKYELFSIKIGSAPDVRLFDQGDSTARLAAVCSR